jgi:tetratricopeptide (TPR) repeat protein
MAHKVKITRKQIKQDDKFLATIKGVTAKVVTTATDVSWLEANRRTIIAVLAAVIAVCLAIGAYFGYASWQRHGAERLMTKADEIYRAPVVSPDEYQKNALLRAMGAYTDADKKWNEAAEAYDELAARYPATKAGGLAAFFAGNAFYQLGKYDKAIERYEAYVERAGKNAPFAAMAKQGMAYSYEAEGKLEQAEKGFQELLAEAGGTTAFLALFDVARVYEKEKQFDKAIETLKKVDASEIAQGPQAYEFKRQAQAKIGMLEARRAAPQS